ncbi:ABC transporter substrate-binding protein [Candidatus Desulforudis audaxviator]|uniref:ABC transporter substrate-binding protein n=1 Tax=Candidatus Desulforudis audaxviator TaxID=471827 RepID=UPI001076EF9D|nr:ABC transporter substrate-binding protein [Candidatus Desulforudis audaxviator]AZK59723.1 Vitamin B12 ABC transporter, B12-binding component BtuF [Candidatus Desulforudis audaxviator]
MRRYWMVLWAVVLAAVLLAAGVLPAVAAQQKRITVTEYFVTPQGEIEKRAVRVPCPPNRVVVLGAYPAEMLKALGVEKAVIAVDEHTKNKTQWPEYVLKVPDVGRSFTPSVEKIIALKPDLVIEGFMRPELRSQLTRAGIPVLKIYGFRTELIPTEIRTLGLIFDCRARANSYAAYIEKQWNTVKERTKNLTSRQKPKVYWESSLGDWRTFGPGSGAHPLIVWAGGINIAAEQRLSYPTVTPEWVAAKNPDVIIKYLKREQAGWTIEGTKEDMQRLEELRRQIMTRPALRHTNAVKHGRVYLISDLISCAPRGAAGEYYIAKWLHPELFRDVNPEAVHREMLKKFYGEELRGVWVYPPLK